MMKEVRNKTRGPVQLTLRSKKAPRSFVTKNIPGIGGKSEAHIYRYPSELHTEYVDRLENKGYISVRDIKADNMREGE